MTITYSCIPTSVPYGRINIPVTVNKYHPTLASMIGIGLGLHDLNSSQLLDNFYTVKKFVLVSILAV